MWILYSNIVIKWLMCDFKHEFVHIWLFANSSAVKVKFHQMCYPYDILRVHIKVKLMLIL